MTRAGKSKPLTEWVLEVVPDTGMTLKQIKRALWTRGLTFNEASLGPTLTYLKDLHLIKHEDGVWKRIDDRIEVMVVQDEVVCKDQRAEPVHQVEDTGGQV